MVKGYDTEPQEYNGLTKSVLFISLHMVLRRTFQGWYDISALLHNSGTQNLSIFVAHHFLGRYAKRTEFGSIPDLSSSLGEDKVQDKGFFL